MKETFHKTYTTPMTMVMLMKLKNLNPLLDFCWLTIDLRTLFKIPTHV